MVFDIKSARDSNTTSHWNDSIWRLFIGNKLFVSDSGQTCFDDKESAIDALLKSVFWKRMSEYIDYSQEFFDKVGDDNWRDEFEKKIIDKTVTFREYNKYIETYGIK